MRFRPDFVLIPVLSILILTLHLHEAPNAHSEEFKNINNTDNVYAENYQQKSASSWWQIGWYFVKEAGRFVERQINLDGQSSVGRDSMYLVSPTIDYNNGSVGSEFYFRPNITRGMSTIDMHGHRLFALDIFSRMSLILSNPSGTKIASLNAGTNQYLFYNLKKNDPIGSWKAQYITNSSTTWQNYLRVTSGTRSYTLQENSDTPKTIYYTSNNRILLSSKNTREKINNRQLLNQQQGYTKIISLSDLEKEFRDDNNTAIDQLRNYKVGDKILVSSPIDQISYNKQRKASAFTFSLYDGFNSVAKRNITWYFAGDLTKIFKPGDSPVFVFTVEEIGNNNGTIFESLDFFEQTFTLQNQDKYPHIEPFIYQSKVGS